MSKKTYTVEFDVRNYNGSIQVEAESPEEAKEIVENLPTTELRNYTQDVAVTVEQVLNEDQTETLLEGD